MPNLVEGKHTSEFLLSEGNGTYSREQATVTQSGAALASGQLLGKVTASGKYKPYTTGASDGTQNAVAVLYTELKAATGDVKATLIVREAEVNALQLTGLDAAARTTLAAAGIVVR